MKRHQIHWLKIFLMAFTTILIVSFIYFIVLYNQVISANTEGFSDTEDKVISETTIVDIEQITTFHEIESYHVVWGTTEDHTEQLAFVPLDSSDGQIEVVDQQDILSQEIVQKAWKRDCTTCQLNKIVPGKIRNNLVWELTYTDEKGRYVFDYLSIYDGSRYEQFAFSTMFK